MAEQVCNAIECLDAQGCGIRVVFQKEGDRFSYTIFGVSNGEERPLLSTVEGSADDFSPPSPPFAELHQQGEMSFLSGATTLGHWSMSVEIRDGKIYFDAACRAHKEIDNLGCTYRVHTSGVDTSEYALELGAATTSESKGGTLHIGPESSALSAAQKFPTTFQWRFSFGV